MRRSPGGIVAHENGDPDQGRAAVWGRVRTTMQPTTSAPKKSGGTDRDDPLTMAQLENALHQRPLVGTCPECGSDATLARDDLYADGFEGARQTCDADDCYWTKHHPHAALRRGLDLPDNLEVEQ